MANTTTQLNEALAIADSLNRDTAAVESAFLEDDRQERLAKLLIELGHIDEASVFELLAEDAIDLNRRFNDAVTAIENLGAVRS